MVGQRVALPADYVAREAEVQFRICESHEQQKAGPLISQINGLVAVLDTDVRASRVPADVMIERFVPILNESAQLLGSMINHAAPAPDSSDGQLGREAN